MRQIANGIVFYCCNTCSDIYPGKALKICIIINHVADQVVADVYSPGFFSFLVGEAVQDLDAAPYGGARFSIDARLAGRSFVKFHLDVSTGDVLREPYELLHGRDWLGFAGIPAANCPAISPEEQFAEKVHAYTLPREGRENTRVKDLVDLSLQIRESRLNEARVRESIRDTFQRRKTHAVPGSLASPPSSWTRPFAEMATECGLEPNAEVHFGKVEEFYRKLAL